MIEYISRDDPSIICAKINELVDAVNEIIRQQRQRNRDSHKNIEKVGEGELLWCKDCNGGEIDLWDASCGQRQGKESF